MPNTPKVFISYSWSTPEYEQFVEELATDLRNNGVDAILDKWRLKPGQDKYHFMESMVTDSSMTKVLVLCDSGYRKKADDRAGGVGTESQIISADLYAKVDQTKFIPVVTERSEDGEAFLPVFLKGRIYVDLSSTDVYGEGLDKLLRLIYDKPLKEEPALGSAPTFLVSEDPRGLPMATEMATMLRAIRDQRPNRQGLERRFVESVVAHVRELRAEPQASQSGYDEEIYQAILKTKALRDQLADYLDAICTFAGEETRALKPIVWLLESLGDDFHPHDRSGGYFDVWGDPFRFMALEAILLITAASIRHERWALLRAFLQRWFLVREGPELHPRPFTVFDAWLQSIDEHRNSRLRLNRTCASADLLKERCSASRTSFSELQQADAFLSLYSAVNLAEISSGGRQEFWRARTTVYGQSLRQRPVFLRAIDPDVRAGIRTALGVATGKQLKERIEQAGSTLGELRQLSYSRYSGDSFAESFNLEVLARE